MNDLDEGFKNKDRNSVQIHKKINKPPKKHAISKENFKDFKSDINKKINKESLLFMQLHGIVKKMVEINLNDYSFNSDNCKGNFSFYNLNKSAEKMKEGWCGIRCESFSRFLDKMVFSLRIDNTLVFV